jgi:CP family cyanate transporter-like MFS transporter
MTLPDKNLSAPVPPHELTLADELLIEAEAADEAEPPVPPTPVSGLLGRVLLGVSLVLVSFNLRPVFSSLSTVLPEARQALGLSASTASLMTTLPVLCLGVFAPFAPGLARRFGPERTILLLLLALAIGTALRGVEQSGVLIFGSALAGAAIAIVNVLLPGLVKRDFPRQVALMTGFYTMALCGGAATAAGATVPLERAFGSWSMALAAWAAPVIVVALLWLPQALNAEAPAGGRGGAPQNRLWRSPLAWQVTFFMGLQSALAYCVFGWLAPILRERGMDAATAGLVVSFSVLVQTAACLLAPAIAVRGRDQRLINVVIVLLAVAGFIGCIFAPLWSVWFWAFLQGVGQGSLIAVALTIIVLRTPDSHTAARLSSMAQSFGYMMAAAGPLLVGVLRDWTGGFSAATILFLAIGAGAVAAGLGAGRNRLIKA